MSAGYANPQCMRVHNTLQLLIIVLFVSFAFIFKSVGAEVQADKSQGGVAHKGGVMSFSLTSAAFDEGATIPQKFTCQGDDLSPRLKWDGAPEGTASFALIMDDPDTPVGTWIHWVMYSIPKTVTELAEAIPAGARLPNGATHGLNGMGKMAYQGPCPPPGGPHRYFFKLYALDTELDLDPGKKKADLLKAMEGHILAETQLLGTYERK